MSNPFFQFKQFRIRHDRCAMKVGTDGVLLGAAAPVVGAKSVLDVGTGTGLIALMLAQREPQARICGVELDKEAAAQATENVADSPWADRVEICCQDFRQFQGPNTYDLIVSNPPYFVNSLLAPKAERAAARHTASLPYEDLLAGVVQHLSPEGSFSLILPSEVQAEFVRLAQEQGLHLYQQIWVQTTPKAAPKRVLMNFSFRADRPLEEEYLVIELERHSYSKDYIALTREFYLRM